MNSEEMNPVSVNIKSKINSRYSQPVVMQCTHVDVVDLTDNDSFSFGNQVSVERERGEVKEDLHKCHKFKIVEKYIIKYEHWHNLGFFDIKFKKCWANTCQ